MTGGGGYPANYQQQLQQPQTEGSFDYSSIDASKTFADITREQYENWYSRFYPEQVKLLESAQTGSLMKDQLHRVDGNFASAAQAAQRGNQNHMARYGLSAESSAGEDAKFSLSKAISRNSIREHGRESSLATMSGASLSDLKPQQPQ